MYNMDWYNEDDKKHEIVLQRLEEKFTSCQGKIAQKEVSQSPLPPSSAVQSRPTPIGRKIEEKLKKLHVSKSSEDESRTNQSSSRRRRSRSKKSLRRMRRGNQIPKRNSEGSDEPQQSSAPTQTQVVAKLIRSPAPKVKN